MKFNKHGGANMVCNKNLKIGFLCISIVYLDIKPMQSNIKEEIPDPRPIPPTMSAEDLGLVFNARLLKEDYILSIADLEDKKFILPVVPPISDCVITYSIKARLINQSTMRQIHSDYHKEKNVCTKYKKIFSLLFGLGIISLLFTSNVYGKISTGSLFLGAAYCFNIQKQSHKKLNSLKKRFRSGVELDRRYARHTI